MTVWLETPYGDDKVEDWKAKGDNIYEVIAKTGKTTEKHKVGAKGKEKEWVWAALRDEDDVIVSLDDVPKDKSKA